MNHLLIIAMGGALGAVMRHLVNQGAMRVLGPEFPYGTLAVNLLGSLAMGLLVGWLARVGHPNATEIRFAFGVGVLGAFTTMSAFSLDVVVMIERKHMVMAFGYAVFTVVLSVMAVFIGLLIARRIFEG